MEILLLFGWFFGAIIVGVIGSERTIGFWATFILALILSPLIGLIIALCSQSKATVEFQRRTIEALNRNNQSSAQRIDMELSRLIQLLNEGKITESEYMSLRSKVINPPAISSQPEPAPVSQWAERTQVRPEDKVPPEEQGFFDRLFGNPFFWPAIIVAFILLCTIWAALNG